MLIFWHSSISELNILCDFIETQVYNQVNTVVVGYLTGIDAEDIINFHDF